MCGIVGFTAPGQDPAAAKQIVQGMADLIRHRGPDGEGCYADGTAALGHRRLSVIDLAGGGQPMLNEDGTLVVVFNGEIYNYKTLRARLQQRGHTFATDSDTEVLLHGYEEWGRNLPRRLRGMFAFAVWDRTRGTLFCARDLFGIKPLCYYKKGETLLFASEIKAFLAHPAFEKRLNEARLPDWLSMEYLPDAETLFTGVYELPPAHTLTWQAGRVMLARYAAPRFRAKRGRSLRAWAREIGDAVAESADAHRIADVEVGCFLSGGVDSSLITCEMARRQPAVQCFSVGYAEEAYSELPAARAAAQALGVPLTETTVTADDFFAANRAIQWYLDEPMPNPAEVPLYFLCKAARQRVKVVLSGEGADELFGGYPLYRQAVWAERWQKMPRAVRRALAALLPGCGLLHRGALPRWQRSARANYVFETTQERDKYLKRDYCAPTPAQRCKPYFDAVRGLDEPTAVQWVDWQTWLPRDILRKADRMSMAHSLELRVPFLDRQVLAAAQALPRRYRCTGRRGKIALRAAAARRLPPQLADAPKRGFPVPLTETTVTADDFFAANRAIQWYLDEPMPNPAEVPLYFLCKAARQRVKVVLSGEGADELFGGYPLYRQAVWAERWQKMPRAVRRALAALLPGCGLLHRGALPRWQRSARANYVFETTQERDKYLKRDYCAPTPAQRCKPYFDAVRGLDEPTAVQWVDWQTWLPRDILRKADRMSMAHSLELRVPFLDRQVLAAAQALPRRYRCTGRRGKIALRAAAARRLPPQLADAPKRGFPVPLADWLRQEKYYALVKAKLTGPAAERFFDTGALCALLDAHRAGKTNAMTKLWAFYCFIEWYEVYFTGKIPPDL